MDIKPIETYWHGYRFRSRSEARWAVFMTSLGVRFEYEPEGFDLGEAGKYLPDFWLPELDCWLEIKSHKPDESESKKAGALAAATNKCVFVLFGYFECPTDLVWYSDNSQAEAFFPGTPDAEGSYGWDCHYLWCECPRCGRVELQFDGRADRIKCNCPKSRHGDKGYNYDSPRLQKAYDLARSARFEHGATP